MRAHLRHKALRAHAVRPDQLGRVGVARKRSGKRAGPVAAQHVQQRLREQAAQEAALRERRAGGGRARRLEVLRQVRHLAMTGEKLPLSGFTRAMRLKVQQRWLSSAFGARNAEPLSALFSKVAT
jgi:hypothetical protein